MSDLQTAGYFSLTELPANARLTGERLLDLAPPACGVDRDFEDDSASSFN